MWNYGLYTLINYVKRKLRQAKHPNETKSTKDTNEQAKVTTKTHRKNKDVRLHENAKYREQKGKQCYTLHNQTGRQSR